MPVRKRLLVLANSAKHDERCVAGREVVEAAGGYRLGGWVRPLSSHGRGELWAAEHAYPGGRSVAVLDVADVALAGPAADPGQPENWSLAVPVSWADVTGRYRRPPAEALVEAPSDLWLQPGGRADRVASDYVRAHPPRQSLVIVRPEAARLAFWSESRPGQVKRKRRCLFRYAGVSYDLPLTDPVQTRRYDGLMPGVGEASAEVPLGDGVLLCVSLAGCFNGYHYKVVATVLEGSVWQPPGMFGFIRSAIRAALWGRSSTYCYGTG